MVKKNRNILKFETISAKLILSIGLGVFAVVLVVIAYLVFFRSQQLIDQATVQAYNKAQTYKLQFEKQLVVFTSASQNLAASLNFDVKGYSNSKLSEKQILHLLTRYVTDNDHIFATGTIREKEAVTKSNIESASIYLDETKRFIPCVYLNNLGTIETGKLNRFEIDEVGDYYLFPQRTLMSHTSNPQEYIYSDGTSKNVVRFSSPVVHLNRFMGITTIDVKTNVFRKIVNDLDWYSSLAQVSLISSNGYLIADSKEDRPSVRHIKHLYTDWKAREAVLKGEEFRFLANDKLNIWLPIELDKTGQYWGLYIEFPFNLIAKDISKSLWFTGLISLLFMFVSATSVAFLVLYLLKPMYNVAEFAMEMASGSLNFNHTNIRVPGREVHRIIKGLRSIQNRLKNVTSFAHEIGKGKLNAKYKPVSESDVLGYALLEMQSSLQRSKEKERKRFAQEEEEEWLRMGTEKFNILFRHTSESVDDFAYSIIKNLAEFTGCGIAGIYLLNDTYDSDVHLQLKAAYAFSKRKLMKGRIEVGQGLVGASALEMREIFLTEIPEDYSKISSSLGEASPRSIFILPLMLKNKNFGVIELASFAVLSETELGFIKSLGESIALTISATISNTETKKLLQQARQQSEELASQEEEMRQNLEELQATQEEAERKEVERNNLVLALNNGLLVTEYELDGTIISVNDVLVNVYALPKDLIEGKNNSYFSGFSKDKPVAYDLIWEKLNNGETAYIEQKVHNITTEVWTAENLTPLKSRFGKVDKIVGIAYDITISRLDEAKNNEMLKESRAKTMNMMKQEEEMTKKFEESISLETTLRKKIEKLESENNKYKSQA